MKPGRIIWMISCIVLLSIFNQLPAQKLQFSHYGVSEGLSQSEILCIYQDSEGYIWIGTQNGLNQFDGYTFEQYFNDPADTNTISNNWIFDIKEDQNGILWIGTKGGLNKFNKRTGRFSRILFSDTIAGSESKYIYGLAVDESKIYINHSPALSVLDLRTGAIQTYQSSIETGGALYDKGFPIIKCSDGIIWIGSVNGLCSFNSQKEEFTYFNTGVSAKNSITDDHITALLEDKHGNVLIGTENGLNIFNPDTEEIFRYTHEINNPLSLSHHFIQSLIQDHSGVIWIGTNGGGLNRATYNPRTDSLEFIHFRNLADDNNYIGHDIVISLFEDRSHNLWIGTLAGMDKTDLKKKSITTYRKSDHPNSFEMLDNVIASVFEEDDHKLWIGTWGKGLSIVDRETNEAIHYQSEFEGNRHIPENHIHVIFKDSKSRIWIGTRNGVSILDRSSNLFVPVEDYFDAPQFNYFENNRVYCIIEDSGNRFWIGTGNGICILDTETKERVLLNEEGDGPMTISRNLVYSLLEDRDHEIWIAASDGLDRYNPSTGQMLHYTNDPGSQNSLCEDFTVSLCEDPEGNIWIGTSGGVSMFNKADSTFTNYSIRDGLPSNIIYDIILDGNNNLWFSTGSGLAMKNTDETSPDAFVVVDELLGREFNLKAVYASGRGELFFGSVDGLVAFHPDSLTDNTYIPPVSITSFEKENSGVRQHINVYTDQIDLSHRDYSFIIEFSAFDFTNPSKNRYSYKMEGISDAWIEIGNRRFVPFTNLPPGSYTFHVKGTNNDGVWNHTGASMNIIIHPPWWRSNYAYAAYVIALILMIVLIIKLRERNLNREKRILEEKIRARTKEIAQKNISLEEQKDELNELNAMKDTFLSILAHDLKNPFASLHALSGLVVENYENMDEEEKMTSLKKINKSSELIFNLLDNLLTWSRSQRGDIEYSPEKFSLSNLVRENINLHLVHAERKGVKLSSDVSDEMMAFGDREMISTVLRNLINNAVKFSHEGGVVEVSAKEKDNFLELRVSDQGIGLSKENTEKIFRIDAKYKSLGTMGEKGTGLGLIICKDFVEKNQGRIWSESQEGSGTTFYFTIPSDKQSFPKTHKAPPHDD